MSVQINDGLYLPQDSTCGQVNCSSDYSILGAYNRRPGDYVAGAPVPSQAAVGAVVIIPTYGGVGYNALSNGMPYSQLTSSGYFTVNNAYPSTGSNNCQKYTTALAGPSR